MIWSRRSALMLLAALPATGAHASLLPDIRFEVSRNGQPIGSHAVAFGQDGGRLDVRIAVAFDVKLLGFTVYRYRHESSETWRGERLMELQSETDDDGQLLSIQAANRGEAMAVETPTGPLELPADTMPTSYWSRRTVDQEVWLDTQAGKVLRGRFVRAGSEAVETAAGTVSADRYDMQGEIDLTLWYAGQVWVGLRFAPGDGSSITYRRL